KSGAGKTTLMEGLCGLRQLKGGSILLDGTDITHLRPGERGIGLVPQDTVLFPHMTVREHLAFAPELAGWGKVEVTQRVETLAESLGIMSLLDRKPQGLSGGEGKRVALGRAIAAKPKLLCLDEALTGLDGETHTGILDLLDSVIKQESLTTLHITHREDEAARLGQSVYSLSGGCISSTAAE
ncbi:MAG: ATP-binding cassette domain-containing protein, partial [Akkermansiaceae bacterium]